MKVLQTRGEFADNGPGSQMLTISTELRRRNIDVVIAAAKGSLYEKIVNAGFEYYVIPEMAFKSRSFRNVFISIIKLSKVLKKENITVVHAHNAASLWIAFFASLIAGMSRKIRFFQSCRGIEIRKYYGWRNWIYLIQPGKIFAVCEWTKAELVKIGVSAKRIIVTYNGVDLERFDIEQAERYRSDIRKEFSIPEDAFVAGIIGRIGQKGHDEIIKAFAKIKEEVPNMYLLLVGEGPRMIEFQNLVKELGVESKTRFAGLRFDSERFDAAFDVFCLPSFWGEMFPNALLEAMAMGKPVISTKLSGIPEIVNNDVGYLIDILDTDALAKGLKELYSNHEIRSMKGQAAYQKVTSMFTIEQVVNRIGNAYIK